MRTFARATVVSALVLVASGLAGRGEAQPPATAAFEVATVHVEQNVTDGDFEVVFDVKVAKDGLAELMVVSPDRRTVVAFKAPDSSTLGIRKFRFESPEPSDFKSLKAAYPEGVYEFSGKTSSGAKFAGKSSLSHRLPGTAKFVKPAPEAANVSIKDFRMFWSAVEGVASYSVEIKQEELNVNFTALVPASSTSFGVPDGFLVPGKQYRLAIGTVTPEGNITFVETTFTTEK